MTADQTITFPADPLLVRLIATAKKRNKSEVVIRDSFGLEKSFPELLSDVHQTRKLLISSLGAESFDNRGLLREEKSYIAMLTCGGYAYIVACFAIRALGGVFVPLGTGVLPEEASYFLSKVNASCLLVGEASMERAKSIHTYLQGRQEVQCPLMLQIPCNAPFHLELQFDIDHNVQLDPSEPGLVFFTSGSTGLPKGALLPRRCFSLVPDAEPESLVISWRPGHWISGAWTLIGDLITGKKLLVLGERLGKDLLEAILTNMKKYPVTHISFSPVALRQLKELLTDEMSEWAINMDELAMHFKRLPTIKSSSGAVDPSTKDFWTKFTDLKFENTYGSTELGGAGLSGKSGTKDSIGGPLPGVKVKLSEGTRGELCVWSPNMLIRYIGDERSNPELFDNEGYLKTGDLAELIDGEYIFKGRANADFIFFRMFRIPILTVEESLMRLPYVVDACVVGVPAYEAVEMCGAILKVKGGSSSPEAVTLARVRSDLEGQLSPFMMPALLRVMKDGEELPRTASGKPIKKQALKDYFHTTDWFPGADAPRDIEQWDVKRKMPSHPRPWDWSGMQRAG